MQTDSDGTTHIHTFDHRVDFYCMQPLEWDFEFEEKDWTMCWGQAGDLLNPFSQVMLQGALRSLLLLFSGITLVFSPFECQT